VKLALLTKQLGESSNRFAHFSMNNAVCSLVKLKLMKLYIGASKHGKRGRGASGKTIVAGVVERKQL
jgi:hypothetical protein